MRKLFGIIFLTATVALWSQNPGKIPGTNITSGAVSKTIALMSESAEMLFANQLPEAEILTKLDRMIELVATEPPGRTRELLRAQSLLLRATFSLQHERMQKAESDLILADEITMTAFDPPDAITYQLLANARSNLMLIRGLFYILSNSGPINDLAVKALQLDPNNAVATIIIAYGKIETPPLFGGNPSAGREMLEKLLLNKKLERPFRFSALLAVTKSWTRENKISRARESLELARQMYPSNPQLKRAMQL